MKVLIIGGVAGGATAAARLRRLDERAEIIILERSGFVSYANCGLPYYIGGVIQSKEALTLQTPESFRRRFRIDVRVHSEVLSIDRAAKTVQVRRLEDGSAYTESYDKLILSPGAQAIRPSLPGIDNPRIMTLRTVEDTYRIREFLEREQPRRAVVVGGGFIGLEMAENLMHAGISTTLLQRSAQVLPPLDYDMACQVHAYLRTAGLDLRLNTSVAGYEELPDGVRVRLKDGGALEADFVLLAIGVTPETHLARDAGLALGAKDSIAVDESMRTSDPDIYAVGDAVEIRQSVSGVPALIALAGPANKQGRVAADNLCGRGVRYTGAQGSSVIKLFDMTVASTGLNEKAAKAAGLRYDRVVTYSPSHAAYYPGVSNLTIKTLYLPESGRIIGAQIVGFDGVDKRIDVMATAIRAEMTAVDLTELDLAYAPPYSSAKDPVNMAGFVIENIRDGLVEQYHWTDLEDLAGRRDVTLLDTRTEGEYRKGHMEGTVNIPLDELRERMGELDPTKELYVNCQSGLRSYLACRILTQNGFTCYNFSGGYHFYEYIADDRRYDASPAHPCGVKL
jgi:NADPH-dependent 2,4-dienoyl-CoA reductase/sulfur reductase-like enzyme/rhodanese-related sulfurtransferase